MAEITDERLDDLEGCEEWFDYLLRELEDLTDSLDEHVTISDVHEAIRSLTVRMRNGGRPESDPTQCNWYFDDGDESYSEYQPHDFSGDGRTCVNCHVPESDVSETSSTG